MISHVISTGLENYLLLTSSDENVIVQPSSGRFVSFAIRQTTRTRNPKWKKCNYARAKYTLLERREANEEKRENYTDRCWNRPSAGCCRKVDGHSNSIWSLTDDCGDRPSIKDLIWELYLIWLSPKSKTQRFPTTSNGEKQLLLTFKKLEPEKFSIFTLKKSEVFSSN